jgi:hypothetical protein
LGFSGERPVDEQSNSLNLTGQWQGQYSYSRSKAPVAFSARLTESNTWLGGLIEEIGTAGDAKGLPIAATVQGRRTGRSVTWLKLYHGNFRLYDTVQYAGEVSEDGLEVEGRWTIFGNWSGRFLMVRQSGQAAARKRRKAVKLPAG